MGWLRVLGRHQLEQSRCSRKNQRAVSSANVKIPPIQLLPFLVMQKMFIAVGKRLTCGVFVLSGITREFGLSLFHVCKRKIP